MGAAMAFRVSSQGRAKATPVPCKNRRREGRGDGGVGVDFTGGLTNEAGDSGKVFRMRFWRRTYCPAQNSTLQSN